MQSRLHSAFHYQLDILILINLYSAHTNIHAHNYTYAYVYDYLFKHIYKQTCIYKKNMLTYAYAFTSVHTYMHAPVHALTILQSPGTGVALEPNDLHHA